MRSLQLVNCFGGWILEFVMDTKQSQSSNRATVKNRQMVYRLVNSIQYFLKVWFKRLRALFCNCWNLKRQNLIWHCSFSKSAHSKSSRQLRSLNKSAQNDSDLSLRISISLSDFATFWLLLLVLEEVLGLNAILSF